MHADALRKRQIRSDEQRRKDATLIVTLKLHIQEQLRCSNCGARAGQPCKHDYGCIDTDRTVR